ncbi:MAG: nucleotide exchange factor GrpE [Corynebacterium sp.]|nr:nucleotide exchange factor GrpE [Corynebacterium sp.]
MTNPGMPNDPGDPDQTDEQNISPDEFEAAADEAAQAQGVDEDDDLYTTQPDPTVDGDSEPVTEDDLAASVDEALADVEAELDEAEAAEDAESPEPTVEAQLAERTEDLQRLSAEYANYRRRTERDRENIVLSAKASVLTSLLPVLDDLDLAKQHGDLEEGPMKALADKLRDTLTGQKLEAFGAEGEAFDPEIHEAVQDLSSGEDKVIGTVLRKGYRTGERLLRTAMVIIADPAADDA